MSGHWLLASNGRRHWFRSKGAKSSACGSMTEDRCFGKAVVDGPNDWPCATCIKYARQQLLAECVEIDAERLRETVERIGNELLDEVRIMPKSRPGDVKLAKRLAAFADELLGRS